MGPDDSLLEPVRRLVRFIETSDRAWLDDLFVEQPVILESFAPFVFEGSGAVTRWADAFTVHLGAHDGLRGELGVAQEFSRDGDTAFFAVPLTWWFALGDRRVRETGGLAVLLQRVGDGWRLARYAWAVTGLEPA
jgi:hypothetical protein